MLPKVLKNLNLFNDANSFLGVVQEVALPKISHAMEDWRGGGMLGPIKIDMGLEGLETEITLGGQEAQFIRQIGATQHDAVLLRFMGAYQSDDDGSVTAVEVVMRGRWQELDRGNAKPGEKTEHKYKSVLSYYEEFQNGEQLLQIDMARAIYVVGGVDRYAEIRAALGVV
jgi:hypothetical protein